MGYILTFLAFLATLVAIGGPTWKDKAKGWHKITAMGWATGIIALAFLILSTISIHRNNSENAALREQVGRMPQLVFRSLVTMYRGNTWHAPQRIPGGALVEFRGFNQDLVMWRDTSHSMDVPRSDETTREILFVSLTGGPDGLLYEWSVQPTRHEVCSGFISVFETAEMRKGAKPTGSP